MFKAIGSYLFRLFNFILSILFYIVYKVHRESRRRVQVTPTTIPREYDGRSLVQLKQHADAIAFLYDESSLKDGIEKLKAHAADCIVRSISAGSHFIKLYDSQGVLASNLESISQIVRDRLDHVHLVDGIHSKDDVCSVSIDTTPINNDCCTPIKIEFTFDSNDDSVDVSEVCEKNSCDYHVRFVSEKDGNDDIARITKQSCESDKHTFTVDSLEASLTSSIDYPDPELCISFGTMDILQGFEPWQTRLTEFFFVGSYLSFQWPEFVGVFEHYGLRNKRFGK